MFDSIGLLQTCEPLLDGPQIGKDVVIDVDFEPEDLPLLQLRLQPRVAAPTLTLLPAASTEKYLKGEACMSEALRPLTPTLSPVVFLSSTLGLSVMTELI